MRRSVPLLMLLVVAPLIVRGQARSPHRWSPLLATQGETIDIDTANVQHKEGFFTTWLRWDLDRAQEMGVHYRLEHVELDCRGLRVRLLSVETVGLRVPQLRVDTVEGDNVMKAVPVQLDSADTQWRQYSRGSLGAQSVDEACRRLTRA